MSFTGSPAGDLASVTVLERLDVAGDITLGAGSVYRTTVDQSGRSPLLAAGGMVTLDGAIVVIDTAVGSSQRLTQAAILTAAGGVRGTAAVGTDNPWLEAHLVSDGRTLVGALLDLGVPMTPAATTTNGRSVGVVLDRLARNAMADLRTVTRELAALDDAALADALDVVSGEVHASMLQAAAADSELAGDTVRAQVGTRRLVVNAEGGVVASGTPAWGGERRRFWGRLLGQHVTFDGGAGLHGGDVEMGGFALGMDWVLGEHWLAGAGGGYGSGRLTLDGTNASGRTTAPRAFGYVGYARGAWTAQAGASAARPSYATQRAIAFEARLDPIYGALPIFGGVHRDATGEIDGLETSVWGEWRVQHAVGSWMLQPGVGVRHARHRRDAWSETGAGALSLSAPAQTTTSRQAEAGARFVRTVGRIRPELDASYRRELGRGDTDTVLQMGSAADGVFTVTGVPFAAHRVIGRAGVAARVGMRTDLSVWYRFHAGSGQVRHALDLGVGF